MAKKKLLCALLLVTTIMCAQKNKTIKELGAKYNPFRIETKISFKSIRTQAVTLSVINILGKSILIDKITAHKGMNSIAFKHNILSPGMYLYAIETSKEVLSKRFVVK